METKAFLAAIGEMAVIAGLLFISAGTANWPGAWIFIAAMLAESVIAIRMLARDDPQLLEQRLALPVQRGQKTWDKILMSTFAVLFIAWLPLMAIDAVRFHWSDVPLWLNWLGGGGLAISFYFVYLTLRENSYAVPVVRIQKERGQQVITTGPYRIVRHPLYASVMIFFPAVALLLGSWYGVAVAALMMALLAVRTGLEDLTLATELDGYADYAAKVCYRLIPGVW